MLTNPFRWTKCMMKKKALVFSPGATFPFRRTSFPASLVVALLFAMFLTLYFIPAAFYVSHKNK